jgi:trk system potassium uptake protein TrkH
MVFKTGDLKIVLRDSGTAIMWFSLTFFVPLGAALLFSENHLTVPISLSLILCALLGFSMKMLFQSPKKTKDVHALAAVVVVWVIICLVAGLPFYLGAGKSAIDSVFQSTSAITTTGLDVFVGSDLTMQEMVEGNYRSLVLWLNFISWIGGAGIMMLVLLGFMTAYGRYGKLTEAEGREERLRPHIMNTAKLIWEIYGAITLLGIILLLIAGMDMFDAVNYSMSAVSTTGLAMKSEGVAAFNNIGIEYALAFIMIMGAISFLVHYNFAKKDKLAYFRDSQILALLVLIIAGSLLVTPKLVAYSGYYNGSPLRQGLFQTISAVTAGGFNSMDMNLFTPDRLDKDGNIVANERYVGGDFEIGLWVLIILMFIGGAAGSTSGGIKLIRLILLLKIAYWRMKRLLLPEDAVFSRKIGGHPVSGEDIRAVMIFTFLYLLTILGGALVLMWYGFSGTVSLFEVTSAQSNVGISLGVTHHAMPLLMKIVLITNMTIGRLEIIPFMVFLGFLASLRK